MLCLLVVEAQSCWRWWWIGTKSGPRRGGFLSVLHIVSVCSAGLGAQDILFVSFHDMFVVVCGCCGCGAGLSNRGGGLVGAGELARARLRDLLFNSRWRRSRGQKNGDVAGNWDYI